LLAWEAGSVDWFGTRKVSHILHHAAASEEQEIDKRLWRAHVAELFPWLEELRVALVDRFRDRVKLPHISQNDEIVEDADLLEIGQLHWNLKNLANVPESELKLS
jgi:hypothetical protein